MIRTPWIVMLALCAAACFGKPSESVREDYVMLVPDFRNDVVYRIALDGEYQGDFLDPARFDPSFDRRVRDSPRGMIFIDESPPRLWMIAERSASEWGVDGTYRRTILSDSTYIEDPTGIVRVGDEVFVTSEDKKIMLVFGLDGTFRDHYGYPQLYRSKDLDLGADGMLYVASRMRSSTIPGLIAVWDPADRGEDAKPVRYHVPPETVDDGTIEVRSFVIDDDGDFLITDFARGRLERWDFEEDEKIEVLLDSDEWGTYTELERGPDGLVYMAGPAGLYRFDSRATAEDLVGLEPFFDARQLEDRYDEEFSPSSILFVPRSALPDPPVPD